MVLPLALLALVGAAMAQTFSNSLVGVYTVTQDTAGKVPLAQKEFPWPMLPEHADTGVTGPRGRMLGYNICNETTLGKDSMCMTAYLNSVDDFCLWGAPNPGSQVGNVEARMVAFCTKADWGTRLIPQGALQGVQFMRTPDYVEVVGMIDQEALNLLPGNQGGEEDPHGADGRGNPVGSLVYTNAFGATNPGTEFQQATEWSFFIGNGVFCFKICDNNGPTGTPAAFCEHKYDEVGCAYNAPAAYKQINSTFQDCEGENQLPAGVFVDQGVTTTWQQTEPVPPYVASIPPSSNCVPHASAELYNRVNAVAGAPQPTATGTPGVAVGFGNAPSGSDAPTPAATGGSGGAAPTGRTTSANAEEDDEESSAPAGMGGLAWTVAAGLSAAVCGLALL